MGCTTTRQKKGGKTSGCNTKGNFSSCMNSSSNKLGQISLATSTTTVKKEHGSIGVDDTVHDCMVESPLLRIQGWKASVHKCLLLLSVICSLLIDKLISLLMSPVALWSRHGWIVLQALVMPPEVLGYEMQAIIIDLVLGGLRDVEGVNEIMVEIITEIILGCLP